MWGIGELGVGGVGCEKDGGGVYGGGFGVWEEWLEVVDEEGIGVDKVGKFCVEGRVCEEWCGVGGVMYDGGNIVEDGVREGV